jgi:hypothetical protein
METHYELIGERTISPTGRERIMLNPQNWLNKKFPLTQHFQKPFDELIDIKNIRTIILIHSDCPRCRELIKQFENQNSTDVIWVELPLKTKSDTIQTCLPIFQLDQTKDWFAITPCTINLKNGICVKIKEI